MTMNAEVTGGARSRLRPATRNRLLSIALASGLWATGVLLFPDPGARAPWLYGLVLTLGYGHLLGAALGPSERFAHRFRAGMRWKPLHALPPAGRAAVGIGAGCGAATLLYLAYASALGHWPWIAGVLLAIATWHSVENDSALPRTYRSGLRLPPLSGEADTQATTLGITALVLALATAALASEPTPTPAGPVSGADAFAGISPGMAVEDALIGLRAVAALAGAFLLRAQGGERSEWLGLGLIAASALDPAWLCAQAHLAFADVFALSTLYHLASWWILTLDKSRLPTRAPGQDKGIDKDIDKDIDKGVVKDVVAVHALPAALLAATWLLPGDFAAEARRSFFSPAAYLFWSVIHAVHTLENRRRRAPLSRGNPRPPGLPSPLRRFRPGRPPGNRSESDPG